MSQRPILITGGTGLLGPYLVETASTRGPCVAPARGVGAGHAWDLTDAAAVRRVMEALNPAVVVNAAALTDVDRCEREPGLADRLNRTMVANLVAIMPADALLVQISTDQVYPDTPGPHTEEGEAPVNNYGATKLAGEVEALRHPHALVLRTNLFGPSRTPGRASLSDFIAGKLQAHEPVTLFRDVLFSPLHMITLSGILFQMVAHGIQGVFNLGCRKGTSKYDFGLMVAAHLGLATETARAGDSTALTGRAKRPLDLRMDVVRIETALGRRMPTLQEEVSKL